MPSAVARAPVTLRADKAEQAVVKRVARRGHDEEGHNGAWKVAFADFCLALLCLFLVMWLLAARQQEALQELLKAAGGSLLDDGRGRMSESLGGPRGALISREPLPSDGSTLAPRRLFPGALESDDLRHVRLAKTSYETSADMVELVRVFEQLASQSGLAGNVQSVITPYGLRVMLHDTSKQGMFERGGAVPNERFARLLRKLGPVFSRIENQMLILGHTDSVQYRDTGPAGLSNWALSSERAMAARAELLKGGMPAGSVLQVVGLAERAPLNAKDTTAPENRRIELLILTKGQASSISAMFGAPGETRPLIEGAETSLPSRDELISLRNGLLDVP
ncbi:MAG TPA: flagellar motor protein MotB [Polyangiaceae bacterium]|nr:flagellar motor protein MotB [Polyangiaceae bacterium]